DAVTAGDALKVVADFRSREMLLDGAGFNPAEAVRSVKLADEKTELALAKQADGSWKYEKPANFGAADAKGEMNPAATLADANAPSGVEPLLTALANLKPTSGEDFIDDAKDLAQYGLEPGKEVGPKIEIERNLSSDKSSLPVSEKLFI